MLSHTGLNACRIIHREMIVNLIYAPLTEFFERIPLGRILNRLSKDISLIENDLWSTIGSVLVNSFNLIGDIFIIVYSSSYYSMAPFFVFVYFSVNYMKKYQNFNREAVRLGKTLLFIVRINFEKPDYSVFY